MDLGQFQKLVLIAVILLLMVALVIIGIALSQAKETNWPPIVPVCPDYWFANSEGKCVNQKNLGTCPATGGDKHLTMDFNVAPFTGSTGSCAKYTWAQKCGITWDGITYGMPNPCAASEPA